MRTIPPPPGLPRLEPPDYTKAYQYSQGDYPPPVSSRPGAWLFYAGPLVVDSLAIICTTVLVAIKILPAENFKYLIGVLVVGNVAIRMPGRKGLPPGGAGFIVAFIYSVIQTFKGFKS